MALGFNKNNSNQSSTGNYNGTQNSNQTSTYSTTPNNPDWVTSGASSLFGGASSLASQNPSSYVAPANSVLTGAGANASALSSSPALQTLQNTFGRPAAQADAVQANGYINDYMSPYTNDVVNSSLASFDNNAGQTRATQALQMAHSGAFGGSGSAITQALTEGQLGLARGQLESGIRNQGFTTALGAAENDANNATSTNVANAQLKQQNRQMIENAAASLGQLQNQNVATQQGIGSTLQNVQQQQASAPLDLQSWLGQYFSGLPLSLFQGQSGTENQTGTQTSAGTSASTGTGSSFGFNGSFGK